MPLVTINFEGKDYQFVMNPKNFSTGSTGFHGQGKLVVSETEKYQINLMAVLIGSKGKK